MMISKDIEELKQDLKLFRHSLGKLMDLEDMLFLVSEELSGNTIKSPHIKSEDEAKYQSGTMIYKNNICDLIERESELIKQRDYYLYKVKKVESFLRLLENDEVKLLEYHYWLGFNINTLAKMFYCDKSTMFRKIQSILDKLQPVARKNGV